MIARYLIIMGTIANFRDAFTNESLANRKYTAFAEKADEEGLFQVAKLFRATAEAEAVHALNHLRMLKEIGTTEQNLDLALKAETEFQIIYPKYIDEAKKGNRNDAVWAFDLAQKAEESHAKFYVKTLSILKKDSKLNAIDYNVCQLCGNILEEETEEKCPICGSSKEKFKKVS